MPGPKPKYQIQLSDKERQRLEKLANSRTAQACLTTRAKIILLAEKGVSISEISRKLGLARNTVKKWIKSYNGKPEICLQDAQRSGRPVLFGTYVVMNIVKIACEMPHLRGRALAQWDCQEIVKELIRSGVVLSISSETVRRILNSHKLKPWRYRMWLSAKYPRNEQFCQTVRHLGDLYVRSLAEDECVLCLDENTSIQARQALIDPLPARPGQTVLFEHEYRRAGALNLLAAFDTRTGFVYGRCYERKRQVEFIDFLQYLDNTISSKIKTIHIVCDNVPMHHGKQVKKWLLSHPRFVFHFTPVHCSWMNQVEQWFGILKRKLLKLPNFKSKQDLKEKLYLFITQWNETAHAFKWDEKTVQKLERIISKVEAVLNSAVA